MIQQKKQVLLGKTINQIESGNVLPKIDVAYKLSIILGSTVEQLFLNDDYNKHSKKQQEETFEKIADIYFNFRKNKNQDIKHIKINFYISKTQFLL